MATLVAILMIAVGVVYAQGDRDRWAAAGPFRWSGVAEWEYYESDSTSQGVGTDFNSFRQKYSLMLDGFLWDPRFNRFSIGLDGYLTDRRADGEQLDSDRFGYRAQSTFFPARPFPLRLYARRAVTDATGAALVDNDRETAAWGAEWQLSTRRVRRFSLLFDRTTFELTNPISLEERRQTGLLNFMSRFGNSDVSFRYGLSSQKERVNATDFERHSFTLTDRTAFDNGATLLVSAFHTRSDALFSTGQTDDLRTSRFSSRVDLPWTDGARLGFSYDLNDNSGRFLDSTSHVVKAQGRFKMNSHWESTLALVLGRIDSLTPTSDIQQDQLGARAGVSYGRDWTRIGLTATYSIGYDRADFNIGPDARSLNHLAQVDTRFSLGDAGDLFSALTYSVGDNDTTGIGFTLDELRATVGWERALDGLWRARVSTTFRNTIYDTFQFGVQESDEISLQGSLSHPRGGVSLSLSTSEGVSDFLPDPGSGSPFLPGTDLVNERDVASAGLHWRILRRLRARVQARVERRRFTTIGREDILSLHPEIEYRLGSWSLTAGYSRYERENATTFENATWLLRVTRRLL